MSGYYEFLTGIRTDPAVGRLNEIQLRALALVARSKPDAPPNLSLLAQELDITVPTMARAADRLAAEGLIEQIRGRKNGVHLKLTKKGAGMHSYLGRMFGSVDTQAAA